MEGTSSRRHQHAARPAHQQWIAEHGLEIVEPLGNRCRAEVKAARGARQASLLRGEQERLQLGDLRQAWHGYRPVATRSRVARIRSSTVSGVNRFPLSVSGLATLPWP